MNSLSKISHAFVCRPRLSQVQWVLVLALFTSFIALQHNFLRLVPAHHWLDVPEDGIMIHDAVAGQPIRMDVIRDIKQPFYGEWVVTVLEEASSGGFTTFCTARGANDYDPEAMLPDDLNLDWWTWPVECDPPAGTYMVRTAWTILLQGNIEKTIRRRSNVFTVLPASDYQGAGRE